MTIGSKDSLRRNKMLSTIVYSGPQIEQIRSNQYVKGRQVSWVALSVSQAVLYVARLIKGGGVRLNNVQIQDEYFVVGEQDLIDGCLVLLATGKKNKLLLRLA